MRSMRTSLLLVLCAALAACSDGVTGPEVVAPDAGRVFPLTAPKGDRIFSFNTGEIRSDIGRARTARLRRFIPDFSAGEAEMMYLDSRQTYSFFAMASGEAPGAKGVIHAEIINATTTIQMDANVDCLNTVDNESWVSGPVSKFVLNGVERQVTFHMLIRVQDNGSGRRAAPDLVSPPFGGAAQACLLESDLPMLENLAGKIRVVAR